MLSGAFFHVQKSRERSSLETKSMQNPLPQMNVTLSVDAMSRRDGPHIRVQLTAAAGSALPNKIERRAIPSCRTTPFAPTNSITPRLRPLPSPPSDATIAPSSGTPFSSLPYQSRLHPRLFLRSQHPYPTLPFIRWLTPPTLSFSPPRPHPSPRPSLPSWLLTPPPLPLPPPQPPPSHTLFLNWPQLLAWLRCMPPQRPRQPP